MGRPFLRGAPVALLPYGVRLVSTDRDDLGPGDATMRRVTRSHLVFDCDAHVTELSAIWDYLSRAESELVRHWSWPRGDNLIVNGNWVTFGI